VQEGGAATATITTTTTTTTADGQARACRQSEVDEWSCRKQGKEEGPGSS